MRYSYSRIEVYLKCPHRFYLQYIENLPTPMTSPLRIGSAAHDFMHKYAEHCFSTNNMTDFDFAKVLQEEISKTLPMEDVEDFMDITERSIEIYHFRVGDPNIKSLFEQKFAFDKDWNLVAWDDKSARFRAIIDRFEKENRTVNIIDYKTDRRIRTNAEVENDTQLKIYAFILSLLMGDDVDEVKVSLDFLRYGKRIGPFQYTIEQIHSFKGYLNKLFDEIDAQKEWKPQLGDYCDYCPFVGKCPLYTKASMTLLDNSTPEQMAEWLFKAKVMTKETTKKLKNIVEHGSPIRIGNTELNFREKKKKQIENIDEMVAKLIAAGIPRKQIWDGLTASVTNMQKAVKGATGAKEIVKEHIKEVQYTVFGFDEESED